MIKLNQKLYNYVIELDFVIIYAIPCEYATQFQAD